MQSFSNEVDLAKHGCRLQKQETERCQWEKERQELEQQVASVRADWQGKLEKALAESHSHQQATAQTTDELHQTLE